MKKQLTTLLALVCALLLATTSCAAAATYPVEGLGTVDVPEKYLVLTPDMPADSEALSALGLGYDQVMQLLAAGNIKLNAIMPDISHEIVINRLPNDLENMDGISDEMLLSIDWNSIYQQQGITVSNVDVYHDGDGQTWVRIWQEKTDMVGLQYYTIYKGHSINLTVTCYTGEVSAEVEATMQAMAESVVFE